MNRLSIKKKLLIYSFLIQLIILIIFSFSLYKALSISSIDKLETTLKVIILDVADDTLEHEFKMLNFNEEKEYKFEPLYIRLLKLDDKLKIIESTKFPIEIKSEYRKLNLMEKDTIVFEYQDSYIISRIKLDIKNSSYVIEVATNYSTLNSTLENLLYILFLIVPIILIFSTIGGYFLIYKSFLPIEKILISLKEINATDLSKRLDIKNNNDEIDLLTKEINNLITRLEVSFTKISQFSSDASHELKTPITIIRGELEIGLRKDRTKDEYKEILTDSLEEILIIQQTIDDLLFLAKSELQLKSTVKDEVYVDKVIIESVKELKSYAKLKHIVIDIYKNEPLQIEGYSKLLKIAIKNILKNAISYSYQDSIVTINNNIKDDILYITIKDTGIGIPKEEQKKIFENFYRTDKSRNKNSGGVGLGMAISSKIIKIHNGTIELMSEENIGTTIKIVIPLYKKLRLDNV